MKITYRSICETAKKNDEEVFHPSLFHGFLTGLLCGDREDHLNAEDAVQRFAKDQREHPFLLELFTQTEKQLKESMFDFDLLLPEDKEPITTRTDALVSWCEGFLSGLNQLSVHPDTVKTVDFEEIYGDLVSITQAQTDALDESEENNAAYEELHEYIRMSVILLYQELRDSMNETLKAQHNHLRKELH